MYVNLFKPLIDYVISLCALVFLSPLMFFTAIIIKIETPGPVFFIQKRLGKNGRVFNVYKFRSMTHKNRKNVKQIFETDPEVTKTGRIIRRFKIDELPQLVNVIKGDMSIVGPRPCLPSLADKFDKNGHKRVKVKPGLTGLAQINGNVYLDWKERWVYDAKYVDNLSFITDFRIIMKTFMILIKGEKKFL